MVPPHVKYVPLDVDQRKLDRLLDKHEGLEGVVASATALPLEDDSFDYALCTNVAHHLSDPDLQLMLAELGRVTRQQLILVDPLRVNRLASRILWIIDRGSYPRSYEELVERLTSRFVTEEAETFTFLHSYVLFVGAPDAEPEPK